VRMKARTTSTQPHSTRGDQAGRAADFIDSIDPKRTCVLDPTAYSWTVAKAQDRAAFTNMPNGAKTRQIQPSHRTRTTVLKT
jgi:hypothetical protein